MHAQDTFKILRFNVRTHTPAVSSSHAMLVQETSPLEPGVLDQSDQSARARGGNVAARTCSASPYDGRKLVALNPAARKRSANARSVGA